ncbi:monovalent cation/H+ antiporter complex subunit F [Cognatishimia sp. MH4019]|uniref:monovalent cation/H+ antiporter complex subunit F n=1 Tax=Cognatishimia sp. MH4019 TaxID=2854030 RepID=UPI001CD6C03F|nr:cation:proton antiporter [Cognatishimia sp. MH4019]
MSGAEFLSLSLSIGFITMAVALVLGFYRLVKGPTLPDRVVALDMMTILIVVFCGLFAIATDERAFLDVAIVLALIGFLATVALARFAERRLARRDDTELTDLEEEFRDISENGGTEP